MPTWFCHRSVYNKAGGFSEGGKVGLDLPLRFILPSRFVFRSETQIFEQYNLFVYFSLLEQNNMNMIWYWSWICLKDLKARFERKNRKKKGRKKQFLVKKKTLFKIHCIVFNLIYDLFIWYIYIQKTLHICVLEDKVVTMLWPC